ncbi:uncharacterized protein MONBRDRAFT_24831 [Monosiga brevicollis MX1]|uniref:Uncharacterized protein n=1 Tax=Monosiga brevicollis TaxID=81824 RepID=A9UXV7_MONBE|nr:uncharacterized protein MONBRDRAFT_24831 [Monosiga brevicollis MX1]EDQ89753.1 predicted protein [Monosiga brevicollis MX1]|eukprot:XP_001745175.1 hypothetical protein [Monosiga brevicollis MX1]
MATAIKHTDSGRPAPVKVDANGSKMKSMFSKTSEEQKIKGETMAISSTFEKYLAEREQAIKLAQKWSLSENSEMRHLISACTDNVTQGNDVMRYYDQTFERLFSTIDRCIKEKKHLHSLNKDLQKLDKRMDKLEKEAAEDQSSASSQESASDIQQNLHLAEATQKEVLKTYRNMHMRIRRALYNLTVARIEQHRKIVALDIKFLEDLNEFKYPSAVHDDGHMDFSSFKNELPIAEATSWYNNDWAPPSWLGDDVIAQLDDEEDGNMSSPGTSPGGSPAPLLPHDHHVAPLEKGLYPGTTGIRSMKAGNHYDDPIEHPNRPVAQHETNRGKVDATFDKPVHDSDRGEIVERTPSGRVNKTQI